MGLDSPKRVHLATRFFGGARHNSRQRWALARWRPRKVLRLAVVLLTSIVALVWIRDLFQHHYDLSYMDDEDEILVARAASLLANASAQRFFGRSVQATMGLEQSMPAGPDGLTRVGTWTGRHPLLEMIHRAEVEHQVEILARPATVSTYAPLK